MAGAGGAGLAVGGGDRAGHGVRDPARSGVRGGGRVDRQGLRGPAGPRRLGALSQVQEPRHQTCAAHLLRRCDELLETARGRGREIPRAVKAILLDALNLRDRRDAGEVGEQDFQAALAGLEKRLRAQLARPVAAATPRKVGCSAIFIASSTLSSPS